MIMTNFNFGGINCTPIFLFYYTPHIQKHMVTHLCNQNMQNEVKMLEYAKYVNPMLF